MKGHVVIYEIHGAMKNVDNQKVSHRRMLLIDKLLDCVNYRGKLVSIADALAGRGDAITIDDGVLIAYETAKSIRASGHEISICVNGYNISKQEDYYFIKLNHILDFIVRNKLKFDFDTIDEFRAFIKKKYISSESHEECNEIIDNLRTKFVGTSHLLIEDSFSIINKYNLHDLHNDGVMFVNHGWTHINYNNISHEDFNKQFSVNNDWICGLGFSFCNEYVVPFGKLDIDKFRYIDHNTTILLADKSYPAGWLADNVYNRYSIDSDEDIGSML